MKRAKIISISLALILTVATIFPITPVFAEESDLEECPSFDSSKYADYITGVYKDGAAVEYTDSFSNVSNGKNIQYNITTALSSVGSEVFYFEATMVMNSIDTANDWKTPVFYLRSGGSDQLGVSLRNNGICMLNGGNSLRDKNTNNYYYSYPLTANKEYKVNIRSTANDFTVWVNGVCMVKSHRFPDSCVGKNANVSVKFMDCNATVSNIKVYKEKTNPASDKEGFVNVSNGMNMNLYSFPSFVYNGEDLSGPDNSGQTKYILRPDVKSGETVDISATVIPEKVNAYWAGVQFFLTSSLSVLLRNDDLFILDGATVTVAKTAYLSATGKNTVSQFEGKSYDIEILVKNGLVSVWINNINHLDKIDCNKYLYNGFDFGLKFLTDTSVATKSSFKVVGFNISKEKVRSFNPDNDTQTDVSGSVSKMRYVLNTSAAVDYNYDGKISLSNAKGTHRFYYDMPFTASYPNVNYYYCATVKVGKVGENWAGALMYLRGADDCSYGVSLQQRGALVLNNETGSVNKKGATSGYINSDFKLQENSTYKIAVYSTPTAFSMWVDGNPAFENYTLPDKYSNLAVNPRIGIYLGNSNMTDIEISDIKIFVNGKIDTFDSVQISDDNVKTLGLCELSQNSVILDWSASGIEYKYCGTDSYVKLSGNSGVAYLNVYIDDEFSEKICIHAGNQGWYKLSSSTSGNKETVISLVKATEHSYGTVTVQALGVNGALLSRLAYKGKRMLFLGDSITCGNEVLSKDITQSSQAYDEDATATYAYLTAKNLDAEADFISWSGAAASGQVKTVPAVGDLYLQYSLNRKYDYIVINLGTNDVGPFTEDVIKQKVPELVNMLKTEHPEASIIWAYGLMENYFSFSQVGGKIPLFKESVENISGPVYFLKLPAAKDLAYGKHPMVKGHSDAANSLTDFINSYVNLKGDINSDTMVDSKDFAELKNLLLNNEGEYNYKNADLNSDGLIDLLDMIKIKKQLAKQ